MLLSTYNGERYLRSQLDSVLAQSLHLSKIIIRDDGSSDRTVEIIRDYQRQYCDHILFLDDCMGNLGFKDSFFYLSDYSKSEYVAFCDQDDIWLPEKLSVISNYIMLNKLNVSNGPVLIHSDLTVVDSNLNVVSSSFIKCIDVDGNDNNVVDILLRNTVTGCAAVINSSLIKISRKHRDKFKFHDECVAVVASLFNAIHYIDKPLVLYRQHGFNVVGAPRKKHSLFNKYFSNSFIKTFRFKFRWNSLSVKIDSLVRERELSSDSKSKLFILKEIVDGTPFRRLFILRNLQHLVNVNSKNYCKIKYALFNKK